MVSGAHRSAERYPFMEGVFRNFHIDGNLARQVAIKGFPLLLNECLWSMSQAMLLQCYSVRGIQAIAAMNITSTITRFLTKFSFRWAMPRPFWLGRSLVPAA